MEDKDRIRVGLVGVGGWGRYGHIPALRLLPEYEIIAVASRRMQNRCSACDAVRYSALAFGDF